MQEIEDIWDCIITKLGFVCATYTEVYEPEF